MIGSLQCVVLDCADVQVLSRFYQGLLGGEVNRPDPQWAVGEGWATLHPDAGPVLAFQRVEDHRPPVHGEPSRPQQFHLDVRVDDLERAQREVVALGAALLDDGGGTRSWRVYADPAGHPFCLVRH